MFTGRRYLAQNPAKLCSVIGMRTSSIAVDMGDLGENLFLFRIEREERQVLGIEEAEDIFVQIEENLIQVAGGMDLVRDPLDVFRELHFLLQFLQVLSRMVWPAFLGSSRRKPDTYMRTADG